jgi:hypothetical protein
MKILIIFSLFFSLLLHAEDTSTEFFLKESKSKEKIYRFNPYETIYSGAIAFVIGNIGFYTTGSSVLKLGYSGIQTIGIINVGRGIYNVNSPSMEAELYNFLTKDNSSTISKEMLSSKLIRVFAREERAKRMALFYGSSLLTLQYTVNAFAGNTPSELKKVYLFMGGVNLIIASYSGLIKSSYEQKVYGENFNIHPIFTMDNNEAMGGALVTYSF